MVRSVVLLFAAALAARAETVQVHTLSREIIESRLTRVPAQPSQRVSTLRAMLKTAGCSTLDDHQYKKNEDPNLLCALDAPASAPVIVVGAHFDCVNDGQGVIDNWTGASLLPSLVESLVVAPRKHRFVFVAFSGEERGLLGSKAFIKSLDKLGYASIVAMVNVDSVGLGPTKVWTSYAQQDLLKHLYTVALTLKIPLAGVNLEKVGIGDSFPFRERKIPSIDLHSITQETYPVLHSSRDQLSAVQLADYYDSYRLIATYLGYLDLKLSPTH
jgi:hypothetical protein